MKIDQFIKQIEKDTKTVISIDDPFRVKLQNRLRLIEKDEGLISIIEKRIGDLNNWSGTYSEILLISFFKELGLDIRVDKNLSKKQTLFQLKEYVNPDVYIKYPYNLYVEVKQFTGTNRDRINNMIEQVKRKTGVWQITADYPYDMFFNNPLYKPNHIFTKEKCDLVGTISKGLNRHYSTNYQHLEYTIYYKENLATISKHSYNSYRFARNFKYYILNHADQILKSKSNILAFVLSPKFNYDFTSSLDKTAFRSLARRVFMELTKDTNSVNKVHNKGKDFKLKISSIVKRITAIAFYVDGIEKRDKFFLFVNPNVNKSNMEKCGMEQFKMTLNYAKYDTEFYYDNFEFDNY